MVTAAMHNQRLLGNKHSDVRRVSFEDELEFYWPKVRVIQQDNRAKDINDLKAEMVSIKVSPKYCHFSAKPDSMINQGHLHLLDELFSLLFLCCSSVVSPDI